MTEDYSFRVYNTLSEKKNVNNDVNNYVNIKTFSYNKSKKDSRDHIYKTANVSNVSNVSSIDLRKLFSNIENQETIGSCTGNAIVGILEYLNKKNKNINIELSRLFIYYNERLLEGTVNYDAGAEIRSGIKACNIYGFCSEKLCPYDIKKFKIKPTEESYLEASKHKAVSYQCILNFNDMKKALIDKNPVVIGFDVYSSFNKINKNGIMSYPLKYERYLGGHAVVIVGFDDNYLNKKGYFICRNSWGEKWGDKGYFYMPYEVIKNTNMSWDFWIITSIT